MVLRFCAQKTRVDWFLPTEEVRPHRFHKVRGEAGVLDHVIQIEMIAGIRRRGVPIASEAGRPFHVCLVNVEVACLELAHELLDGQARARRRCREGAGGEKAGGDGEQNARPYASMSVQHLR